MIHVYKQRAAFAKRINLLILSCVCTTIIPRIHFSSCYVVIYSNYNLFSIIRVYKSLHPRTTSRGGAMFMPRITKFFCMLSTRYTPYLVTYVSLCVTTCTSALVFDVLDLVIAAAYYLHTLPLVFLCSHVFHSYSAKSLYCSPHARA
jgi:hypothetical protein